MKTISRNIKRFRLGMGWNQGNLATKLKISGPALSKIETGKTDINISRLHQIAALFKVSILDLFTDNLTELKSEEALQIEILNEELNEKNDQIIKLQMKLLALYEGRCCLT